MKCVDCNGKGLDILYSEDGYDLDYETKCETCNGTGEVEPIKEVCEIKQLTIEELREQFEANGGNWEKSSMHLNQYYNGSVQNKWEAYQRCAIANNIIKE